MQKSTQIEEEKNLAKNLQIKHLGGRKKPNHKRRRSQPLEGQDPDKFEKMYDQNLQHYTTILFQESKIHPFTNKKGNQEKCKGKSEKQSEEIFLGQRQMKEEMVQIPKDSQNLDLLNLLKGMNMDSQILVQVLEQSKRTAKQW